MTSKKAAVLGLCSLLLGACQALTSLETPGDWSMVRVPVGLNAWLPCIPVEKSDDQTQKPGNRKFECRAGKVLIRVLLYGSGTGYNLEKGAAGFERALKKAAERDGAQVDHHQTQVTVSGLPAIRMTTSLSLKLERSKIDGILVSDGKKGWLIDVIYPSLISSSMEPQLTKLFQTVEVKAPGAGSPSRE
ncbi:MAG TPA: hypothetical protein VF173_12600 [Thermoanaerobaculia bacterium]|nr:hypothetical protein [Thermoanaerobaculia bacterium]